MVSISPDERYQVNVFISTKVSLVSTNKKYFYKSIFSEY